MSRHERLLAELETYAGADPAEERHRVAMVELLSSADACGRSLRVIRKIRERSPF